MSVDETPRTGFDRRSALKKAAVAGTVAWTAPAILSERAQAAEFIPGTPCTLKCVPSGTVSVGPNAVLFCPDAGTKWVELTLTFSGVGCPCSTTSVNLIGASTNTANSAVKPGFSTVGPSGASIVVGGPGSGALGDGSYTATLVFCVQCFDRNGANGPDPIRRVFEVAIDFTFTPANSECSQPGNVGTATLNNLTIFDPECLVCPAPG